MVATLAWFTSTAVFVLKVAEILLSKSQKDWIDQTTLQIWNFLDELAKLSFLNWLRRRKAQWAIAAVAALLPVLAWEPGSGLVSTLLLALVALLTIAAGPLLIAYAVGGQSALAVFGRTVLVVVSILLITAAIHVVVIWGFFPAAEVDPDLSHQENVEAYIEKIFGPGYLAMRAVASLAGLLSLIIIAPLALIFIARAILTAVEFVVRRIAELPSGPLVAISGLVSAIIAYMKSFG